MLRRHHPHDLFSQFKFSEPDGAALMQPQIALDCIACMTFSVLESKVFDERTKGSQSLSLIETLLKPSTTAGSSKAPGNYNITQLSDTVQVGLVNNSKPICITTVSSPVDVTGQLKFYSNYPFEIQYECQLNARSSWICQPDNTKPIFLFTIIQWGVQKATTTFSLQTLTLVM